MRRETPTVSMDDIVAYIRVMKIMDEADLKVVDWDESDVELEGPTDRVRLQNLEAAEHIAEVFDYCGHANVTGKIN